jgi:amidase
VDKNKLHPLLVAPVENNTPQSRQAQLEALDGCSRLRPIFDELASKYDALLTPTAADEAPQGMKTGDAVRAILAT